MVGRILLAGEAGSCMNTNGRQSLERIGKAVSFVAAWGIVGFQLWQTQYGREPHWMFMGLAVAILAPSALDFLLRWRTGSSGQDSLPASASSSSAGSDSSGGSPREQT